jgi:hypothetical protein
VTPAGKANDESRPGQEFMPAIDDATGIEFGWRYDKPEGGLSRDLCNGLCGRRQTLTA